MWGDSSGKLQAVCGTLLFRLVASFCSKAHIYIYTSRKVFEQVAFHAMEPLADRSRSRSPGGGGRAPVSGRASRIPANSRPPANARPAVGGQSPDLIDLMNNLVAFEQCIHLVQTASDSIQRASLLAGQCRSGEVYRRRLLPLRTQSLTLLAEIRSEQLAMLEDFKRIARFFQDDE